MRSLLILVSDSAGFLHQLLTVERPEPWQRAAIVREWQRLRSAALDFNHCDGYDYDRWWKQIRHYDAADEAAEQERIRHFATLNPWADDEADQGKEDERDTPPPASGAIRSEGASRTWNPGPKKKAYRRASVPDGGVALFKTRLETPVSSLT
ncbi:hypothetical protein [Streptomyces sp. MH13]|uniref:hypothetical protein n=1 Tax=Streptomyces sp. MH13 TaxID=3417651 RepID=UPI003CE6BE52